MSGDPVHAALDTQAAAVEPQVIAWRHHLHQNPELSNREVNTARLIADHLTSLGLDEVRTGISGHGVVGVLRGGLPGDRVVALRADIDALPVKEESGESFASTVVDATYPGGPFPVSHACGHDGHTAMLLGAATVLAGLRDRLPGTVLFVFQPAEEGAPAGEKSGAKQMLDEGACDDPVPTMAFGMHLAPLPDTYVGYRVGNQFGASCMIRIVLTGQQVHGSTPWMGVDPMPAAGAIMVGIGQLYRQVPAFDPVTVTIGHVEDIGRFNIVPGTVTLWGTIRCSVEDDMADLQKRLTTLAEQTAAAYGCTAEVAYLQDVPAVHNLRKWIDAVLPTVERVVGKEKVYETPPTLGYDDVSEFVNAYGGVYLMLGAQDGELDDDGKPRPTPGGRGLVQRTGPLAGHCAPDATGFRLPTSGAPRGPDAATSPSVQVVASLARALHLQPRERERAFRPAGVRRMPARQGCGRSARIGPQDRRAPRLVYTVAAGSVDAERLEFLRVANGARAGGSPRPGRRTHVVTGSR